MAKRKAKSAKQEKSYSYLGYCNLIKAGAGARLVAKKKFSGIAKKTVSEWQEMFKEAKISQ